MYIIILSNNTESLGSYTHKNNLWIIRKGDLLHFQTFLDSQLNGHAL